ncbi:MAG: hypothetical protein IKW90_03730 [Lachnospiraceae bacterium]|nr:hypothetical protein [Lachnospiraceae bacterium]MBR5177897.1 hypothetical protein [Lachnospiraceae bacterium]
MYKKVLVGLTAVILLGLLAAAGIIIYEKIAEKYKESEVKMNLSDYYTVPDGEAMLIFDEKVYEKNALFVDGEPYLDFPTVTERYTTLFMWSPEENRMYYTTASKEYLITPGEKDMLVNEEKITNTCPAVIIKNDTIYISMSFLKECSNITYRVYTDPARVLVTYSTDEYLCATLKQESSIRVSQDIKADYLEKLPEGSVVRIIEGGGIQQKGFIKVMSEDGVRGYILQEKLDWANRYNVAPTFNPYTEEEYKHIILPEKIYLIWQLVYSKGHIDEMVSYIEKNPEVNVVSPTWFFMSSDKGDIISYGDADYVTAAHERKVNVWALLKNDTLEGAFKCAEDSHKVFSTYENRQRLIRNVIDAVKKCGADGINVDVEGLNVETGIYFVQFLRELSFRCRDYGIVLSVDNYIPEEYNAFYNIPEQKKCADYIVIMGYDEHYAGSDAGSVASLSWFKYAADLTLKKCGPEQIIMGVPFYTRLWKEVPDGDAVKTYSERTMNLREQEEFVAGLDFEPEWKDKEGQYYYEYEEEGATFKLWAEEKRSLALKAMVIGEKEFGGTAAWMMGGDTDGIWTVIKEAVNGDVTSLLKEDNADIGVSDDSGDDMDHDNIGP